MVNSKSRRGGPGAGFHPAGERGGGGSRGNPAARRAVYFPGRWFRPVSSAGRPLARFRRCGSRGKVRGGFYKVGGPVGRLKAAPGSKTFAGVASGLSSTKNQSRNLAGFPAGGITVAGFPSVARAIRGSQPRAGSGPPGIRRPGPFWQAVPTIGRSGAAS